VLGRGGGSTAGVAEGEVTGNCDEESITETGHKVFQFI